MQERKIRQSNFEILRIMAMAMVIALHYLVKGEIVPSSFTDQRGIGLFARLLESFCIVAVNVYVLLSGYFIMETKWNIKKLIRILAQVWFYSLMIPLVCLFLDLGEVSGWDLYDWITVVFPLQMEHYWFATAYLLLYVLTPMIRAAVTNIGKKELGGIILFLLLFFCLPKSFLPIRIPTDRYGYDFGWFLCLYLIAAYLRLYGIGWFNRIRKGWMLYLVFSAAIFGYSSILGWFAGKGYPLLHAAEMNFSYNHLLVLLASVSLFYGFVYMRFPETAVIRFCRKIASYTFGVYLLHEHIAIRYLWQRWLGIEKVKDSLLFLPHMVFAISIVFVVGVGTDYVRNYFFTMIEKAWIKRKRRKYWNRRKKVVSK